MTQAWIPLRRLTSMAYGDALSAELRCDGSVPVMSSGGVTGLHSEANTTAPVIVVGRKGSYGSVHWSDVPAFVIDTAYYIDRSQTTTDLRWLYYVLSAADLGSLSQDVGVPGLSREGAYTALVPYPPPEHQQRRIADFLDDQVARLDRLMSKTQRQADLSTERLLSLRDERICGARNARLVPLHTLTDSARPIVYGIVQAGPQDEQGVPYIKTGDVHRLDPDTLSKTSPEIDAQYSRSRVGPGDIVIAMRASIGASVVVPATVPRANLTQGTARIAARAGVHPIWLFHAIRSVYVQSQFDRMAVGSTFRTLNIWDLRRVLVPVPAYDTQVRIAHRLSDIEEQTDSVNSLLKTRASLVVDRRRALITAAVRGEFDVTTASGRGVA